MSLLAKKVLHMALPLWFGVCGIGFYLVPFILPTLRLVPPEATSWIYGYRVACFTWMVGAVAFGGYFIIRGIFASRALKAYCICDNERINRIYKDCVTASGLKKAPVICFGTLKEPACVVAAFYTAVILNESIIEQLTDKELTIVLCHELTHIKRGHHIYQKIFDFVSIIHWVNPFVWISKNDFAANCEMDCDQKTLYFMNGKATEMEYATTMLHLMELSSSKHKHKTDSLEAVGFLLAKQRIGFILNEPASTRKRIACIAVLTLFAVSVVMFSIYVSRTYFYPYPAYGITPEYSAYSDV
jgi:beta-lactamase regulating signal transducer with metallopeptidase domain